MADISQDVLEKTCDMLAHLESSSVSQSPRGPQATQASLTEAGSIAHLGDVAPTEVTAVIPRKHGGSKLRKLQSYQGFIPLTGL